MAEFEVSVVFDERKCSNQDRFLCRRSIFNVSGGCFYIISGKRNSQNKDEFCQNMMNFECGFNNFGNIFFSR